MPSGIKERPGGGIVFCAASYYSFMFDFLLCSLVVTFRKVQAIRREPTAARPTVMASRKRKFPGAGMNI